MSAPNLVLQEAEQLRLGVLSARAANALQAVLEQRQLPEDERDVLFQAADFLTKVVQGARFTASGTFRAGLRPSQSIAALDFAEIPIDFRIRGNRAAFYADMAAAVTAAAQSRVLGQRRGAAQHAVRFFRALDQALRLKREIRRQIGHSTRRRLAA